MVEPMEIELSDTPPWMRHMTLAEDAPKVIGIDTHSGALAAVGTDGRITLHGDQEKIKTVGTAHISIVADLKGVPIEVMAVVYGIERYIDDYGRHRIESLKAWEARSLGEGLQAYTFIFKKDCNDDGD